MPEIHQDRDIHEVPPRRKFLSNLFMISGLVASYGLLGGFILKFIHPGKRTLRKRKMFVTTLSDIPSDGGMKFSTPAGETYWLIPSGDSQTYKAFSTRCPHLGCNVDWQSKKKQYYCPCHAGAFDENGVGIAGPPAKAGQSLKSTEIVVQGSSLYAMVEAE